MSAKYEIDRLNGEIASLKQQLLNSASIYDAMEATAVHWRKKYSEAETKLIEERALRVHDAQHQAAQTRKAYIDANKDFTVNEALHGNTDEWDEWIAADDGEVEPDTKSGIARKWAERHNVPIVDLSMYPEASVQDKREAAAVLLAGNPFVSGKGKSESVFLDEDFDQIDAQIDKLFDRSDEQERRLTVAENMLRVINGDREGLVERIVVQNRSITELYARDTTVHSVLDDFRDRLNELQTDSTRLGNQAQSRREHMDNTFNEHTEKYVDLRNNIEALRTQMFNHHNEQQKGIRALDEKIISEVKDLKQENCNKLTIAAEARDIAVKVHHTLGRLDHELGDLIARFNTTKSAAFERIAAVEAFTVLQGKEKGRKTRKAVRK